MFISIHDIIINTRYIKEIYAGNVFKGDYIFTIKYIDGTEKIIEFDEAIECEIAQSNLDDQLETIDISIFNAPEVSLSDSEINPESFKFKGLEM